jgi:hypothetical protein
VAVSGTNNTVTKFTGSGSTIGNSTIVDDGTNIKVTTTSFVAGFNPTPFAGTIQDGVTSVLDNLNNWGSSFYQGTVLYSETAGATTITFGQLCYRTNAETWELADATTAAAASTYMLGICLKTAGTGAPTSILINGFVQVSSSYATILKTGEPLFMSTTAGSMNKTAPTTAGNVVRIIGNTFWDSNSQGRIVIHFNPDKTWIEL